MTILRRKEKVIVDKKGRIFGKISIIDIIIIILIIAVVFVGFKVLKSDVKVVKNNNAQVYYTVEFFDVGENFFDEIKEGIPVQNAVKNFPIGQVHSVEKKPFVFLLENYEEGTYEEVEKEGRYSVLLTIKANCSVDEKNIIVGDQIIKVGEQLPVKGKGFAGNTCIVKVELGGDK